MLKVRRFDGGMGKIGGNGGRDLAENGSGGGVIWCAHGVCSVDVGEVWMDDDRGSALSIEDSMTMIEWNAEWLDDAVQ